MLIIDVEWRKYVEVDIDERASFCSCGAAAIEVEDAPPPALVVEAVAGAVVDAVVAAVVEAVAES